MAAVVLHLSDIHIRSSKDPILLKGPAIAACTFADLPEASVVFVVVSGDIAFSGKGEEYKAAASLFQDIRKSISAETDVPVHFLFVPGNHDCDFSIGGKPRLLTLNAVREDPTQLDDDVIAVGASTQTEFRKFSESLLTQGETRIGDALWISHRFTVEGKEVVFDGINVAWCSNLKEEPGSLIFPIDRYTKLQNEVVDLRISVIHQPLNWFHQSSYHPFRRFIRQLSNVVMTGHEHVGGAGEDLHTDSGHSAYIEGCVLQGKQDLSDSSFNVVVFNLEEGTYKSSRFLWSTGDHYALTEEGTWADFRDLPRKMANRFAIEPGFEQLLADPGGAFHIKGGPIALQDLYVYPDVQEVGVLESRNGKKISSSTIFHDASRLDGGVLLTGEEKAGATSLLFMLFRHFHDRGLVPVYLRGLDIKGSTDRDVQNALKRAIAEQYGDACIERFQQKPNSEKVLLLDDFDDGDLPPTSRTRLNQRSPSTQENDGHEEEQIQRRTNHWFSTPS